MSPLGLERKDHCAGEDRNNLSQSAAGAASHGSGNGNMRIRLLRIPPLPYIAESDSGCQSQYTCHVISAWTNNKTSDKPISFNIQSVMICTY
jgi:hypothetical protein